ncbi:hypothetical protein AB205_0115040 [Aquarana catesbeiana]|uniref:Uncharacterized protein n=1 Tax=Aquarana catesbeiana TaxID=8400 RepID=A0A2G9S6N0_AQUCT|nr:hypothetical protein AB205_0115040 [Aquarana catesbeiana]
MEQDLSHLRSQLSLLLTNQMIKLMMQPARLQQTEYLFSQSELDPAMTRMNYPS